MLQIKREYLIWAYTRLTFTIVHKHLVLILSERDRTHTLELTKLNENSLDYETTTNLAQRRFNEDFSIIVLINLTEFLSLPETL